MTQPRDPLAEMSAPRKGGYPAGHKPVDEITPPPASICRSAVGRTLGSLTAADLDSTVRFRDGGALYEGQLQKVEHEAWLNGGQADGEGVRLRDDERDAIALAKHRTWHIACDGRCGGTLNDWIAVDRELVPAVERILTARLAARPVLSREALADANDALHKLSAWIDAGNAHRDPEAVTWGRLAKITEEAGEAIAAYIGMTGQNPRKGVTHSLTSVQEELLDVAVTALGAVAHLHGNDGEDVLALLRSKIERVAERALHADVLTAGGEQE